VNITGSKRSDAVERLEAVLSSAPVVLFELDASGRIVRSEGVGLRSLGATGEPPAGRTIFDVSGAPARLLENVRRALEGDPRATISEVDGLCYELHFVPLRDAQGAVSGVLGIVSDLSERSRARELLGPLAAIVWTADAATMRFTFVSPRALALTGYPEAEWIARPDFLAELLHPDDRDVARDLRLGAVRDGTDRHWVHRVVTRDGRVRWFATTIHPMQGGGQLRERLGLTQTRELLGIMTDVSDHIHAEATLQKSEARLQLVLGQLPAIIWTTDRQLRFTTSVGAGLKQLGIEENALVGHTVQQSLATEDPNHPLLERIRRVIEIGGPERLEAHWFGRTYDTYVEPLRDSTGGLIGALGLSLDVTEKKATEDALARAEETLRQAQKMEAIGRLAGGVAHDFNNLLSIIVCHADLLLARGNASAGAGVQEIRSAASRAGELTRQLLAFSRRQVLKPSIVDPSAIVSSVTAMLSRIIGSHIHVVVFAEQSLGLVKVDATQLEQVVMNLIVNARDAMPDGGTLTVATKNVNVTARDATVPAGSYVVISVTDTGIGMDDETRARMFEPFFTTKPVGEGTGLGLSTVLGIVEQSGGHVTVESAPGRGTTFGIYLPRTDETAPTPPSTPDPAPSEAATILVVEDEDSVRSVVRAILDLSGYRVIAVASAEDALKVAEAPEHAIDLLLTDVVMPGIGGRELADRVLAARPGLRVLFMSGYIEGGPTMTPGLSFLQKPFTPDELEAKVRASLASRRG
jgi:two-component system cell cycle sensor histidine kinase/response regulator CckA